MIQIDKITIAVSDMKMMEKFYSAVFGIEFKKHEMGDFYLLSGMADSIQIMLCPKEMAGIEVDQNNIQLRFAIDDIEKVLKAGLQNFGTLIEELQKQGKVKFASLRDPDGNSIELVEK